MPQPPVITCPRQWVKQTAVDWSGLWPVLLVVLSVLLSGCKILNRPIKLPSHEQITREQVIIHSDFRLPKKHRLFDSLESRRTDMAKDLLLPSSDEPIHIYLFSDQDELKKYFSVSLPALSDRRAIFVKSDTELRVFAYWGDRVAEDLRHEVTHGYLHSVVDNVPLWLDEGIAEYYEVERAEDGRNKTHIFQLANQFRKGDWHPNLQRLEMLANPDDFKQIEYAEAWLWVHFLMHHSPESRKFIQDALARLRMSGDSPPISQAVLNEIPDSQVLIVEHLKKLAEQL